MEVPAELKTDLHRALFGPLSLASEFFGALLPGSVFLTLVCVKRGWASSALGYPLLGYKTKLIALLVAAYLTGKVTLSVVSLFRESALWLRKKIKLQKQRETPPAKNPAPLQIIAESLSKLIAKSDSAAAFVGGLFGGALIANKPQVADHLVAHENYIYFHLNTGLVLIICSAVPGDGNFRILEAAAGVICLIRGIKSALAAETLVFGLAGTVLNAYIGQLNPEQVTAALKSIWNVVVRLSTVPTAPATSVTQAAAPTRPGTPESSRPETSPGG